jgi:uncharacterized protein YjcR
MSNDKLQISNNKTQITQIKKWHRLHRWKADKVTRRQGEKGSFEVKKLGKLEVMKIKSWEDLWGRAARDNRAREGNSTELTEGSPTIYISASG